MALVTLLALAAIGALILAPQFWVKAQMRRHAVERDDFPGTGGELAQHLVERFGLERVRVETTDKGDHYDPEQKVVRLLPQHHDGRSLTAIAIAAHEVGHALQDHNAETGLRLRNRLVRLAMVTDRFAAIFFIAAPVLGAVVRTPAAFFGLAAIGVGLLVVRVLVHLVTLPVEYDASFGKALPILKEGGYLAEEDIPAARSVLKAAALTYVSAALMGLIDLARWIRLLR